MKKSSVIEYFGNGSTVLAAKKLGVHRQTLWRWATDAEGNLISPSVRDSILATATRLKMRELIDGKVPVSPIEVDLISTEVNTGDDAAA